GGGIAAVAGLAHADPDVVSPRTLGMGESLRAAASGSLSTTLNPAGIALTKTYVLEGGYGYRPEGHSNNQTVPIWDSTTSRLAACLAYNHLSSDLTTDGQGGKSLHDIGLTLATHLGDSFIIGTTSRYVSYSETLPSAPGTTAVDGPNSHSGLLVDAG